MSQNAELPSAANVQDAAAFLRGRVTRTPALRLAALEPMVGCELWVKCENLQHIGAFKARGALYAVGRLPPEQVRRGVVTYSSGNHAQAVALAARAFGTTARVAMPTDAPRVKVEAVRSLGAEIVFAGTTSRERQRAALALSAETGAVIIAPFDDPHIIAGQGTATLELCDYVAAATDGAGLDALLVPVGGGGLIAGACLVAAERGTRVVSVEPEGCDAMARSMESGQRVTVEPAATLADGLKPVEVGALNFAVAQRHLAAWLRVDDEAIGRTLVTLLLHAKLLVEPSGAAALAALFSKPLPFPAKRVGVILSGGNIGKDLLTDLLARFTPYEHAPLAPGAATV
jgi:threonine dehydratase